MHFKRKNIKQSTISRMIEYGRKNKVENELKKTIKPMVESDQNYGRLRARNANLNARRDFTSAFKESLLFETLYKFYEASCIDELKSDEFTSLKRSIVQNFINENTTIGIMNTMRRTSLSFREMMDNIDSTTRAVLEENKDKLKDPKTTSKDLTVDPRYKDSFINKMEDQKEEIEDIGQMVQTHVATNVEDFIASNVEDKQKIKDVLNDVKAKVSDIKAANADVEEEIKESAIIKAKRKIHKINNREKNILECMVNHIAKRSINDKLDGFINESGTLNMDKIVVTAEAMMTMMVLSEALGFKLDEKEIRAMYS